MQKRRRFDQTISLKDRLASFAKDAREKASVTLVDSERNDLLMKANQADDAARLDDWARSLFSELGSQ